MIETTSQAPMRRLAIAFAVVGVWALITVFGGLMQAGQGALADLVSRQIVWATPAAALFLLLSAKLFGWRDLGLNPPRPASSVKLFWLLGLYISILAVLAVTTKDIAIRFLLIVAINTAFVGFSEELAFRGVLWGAARKAVAFWPAVLLVSASFGAVHILNALITGELGEAGVQALNAFLSGLGYIALRIRTRSIVPIFIAHWLWDLGVFLNASSAKGIAAPAATSGLLTGALLVAPIALYGLWLILRSRFQFLTDDPSETRESGRAPVQAKGENL